tara:strand:- start:120 stop:845 length:726 start_codon:yes stop_codon:yes gene_type:complete
MTTYYFSAGDNPITYFDTYDELAMSDIELARDKWVLTLEDAVDYGLDGTDKDKDRIYEHWIDIRECGKSVEEISQKQHDDRITAKVREELDELKQMYSELNTKHDETLQEKAKYYDRDILKCKLGWDNINERYNYDASWGFDEVMFWIDDMEWGGMDALRFKALEECAEDYGAEIMTEDNAENQVNEFLDMEHQNGGKKPTKEMVAAYMETFESVPAYWTQHKDKIARYCIVLEDWQYALD